MAENSEGKHILRSVDQVGVARSERKDHLNKSEHPKGAMEEVSGRVQKASTHASGIGVDIAIVERDCAAGDVDATSILPNNRGTSVKASTPSGRWGGFMV